MTSEKYGFEVFASLLQSLDIDKRGFFLGGGQAVNFWSTYLRDRFGPSVGLEEFLPFVSKDCDLFIDYPTMKFFQNAPGDFQMSDSPADGQVAIYTMPGEEKLRVDLMSGVYGVPVHELERVKKRAMTVNGIVVIDPL